MWEAVLPCLHYLPPMTPVKHVTPVFGNAVEVLIHLANIRYPEDTKRKERSKLLSEILRNSMFQGMSCTAKEDRRRQWRLGQVHKEHCGKGKWRTRSFFA